MSAWRIYFDSVIGVHPEIGGDLLEHRTVATVANDPDNIVTSWNSWGYSNGGIRPARPAWASDLGRPYLRSGSEHLILFVDLLTSLRVGVSCCG
jgi:hypothetical protein